MESKTAKTQAAPAIERRAANSPTYCRRALPNSTIVNRAYLDAQRLRFANTGSAA
ncbi:hypothetical protein [Methylibium sp.]|uniref:hypothetical protein n=1 Tax=Methylibium sp. TaxID=2067992 RepID=UPI003BA97564